MLTHIWRTFGPAATAINRNRFAKLTTATVPWLAGLEGYRPRWTSRQHTYLRRRVTEAVAMVRAQLLPGKD